MLVTNGKRLPAIILTALLVTFLTAAAMPANAIAGQTGKAQYHRRTARAPARFVLPFQSNQSLLKQATRLGAHSANSRIELTIGLKLRNTDELHHFLRAVLNPASPLYRKFLTPAEFTARYGPTQSQVEAVTDFLTRHHITVQDVSSNHILIHSSASTAAYEHAFGIRIDDYRLDGRTFFSTMDRPRLPVAIASLVTNIIGLNNADTMHAHHRLSPLSKNLPRNLSSHAPPAATSGYYNPFQIATAYGWPAIDDAGNGAGVTTAILTASSSGLADNTDYRSFWAAFGLPDHTVNVIPVDGDNGATGGMGETLLDIEWSGAMGPGQTLNVYVAADAAFSTFTDMYNRFVTDNTAQVMTTSWGAPEVAGAAQTDDELFMQAAAQGISMFAAAGDNGSGDGSGQSNMADYPSSSPWITAANGTELHADKSGQYLSETAWSGSGGAISQIFTQPVWQFGPGVPQNGWRNNSDMAMNAGGAWPYLMYSGGQWGLVYGTSAVAPQFAGLFAIAVSQNGGSPLGQSNALIYNDVNAGNYHSDFRDVTSGNNGAYAAGPDWDHPTGWGSPRATNLLAHIGIQGPAGTLAGKVSAADGKPIAGATITLSPTERRNRSDTEGNYSILAPIGPYTATATAFGYAPQSAQVTIAKNATTHRNFSLTKAPSATVSGIVRDGTPGGHTYGLYAEIQVTSPGVGQVADVWSDPLTGAYRVSLPEGVDYTLRAIPWLTGYSNGTASVADLHGDITRNLALTAGPSCAAPGYVFNPGAGESFDGANFPPAGWTVVNAAGSAGSPVVWKSNSAWGDPNWTGGTGDAATADSTASDYYGVYDTSLVSPSYPVDSLGFAPALTFLVNFQRFSGNETLAVGISYDNGANWRALARIRSPQGGFMATPGVPWRLSLPIPVGTSDIKLRWRYYNTVGGTDWYAQVDDVAIGKCVTVPGALVSGVIRDAASGQALLQARIADDAGNSSTSFDNAADPDLPAGYYFLSVPVGSHMLTASASEHSSKTATIDIAADEVAHKDFALGAPRFSVQPGSFELHVPINDQVEKTLTLTNSGSGAGTYRLLPFDTPPPAETRHAGGASTPTPLLRIRGHYSPARLASATPGHVAARFIPAAEPATSPGTAWQAIPSLPLSRMDNAAVRDPATGLIYTVAGTNGLVNYASMDVYDPTTEQWSAAPAAPIALEAPAAAFIAGRIYLANGWTETGAASPTLSIYDTTSTQWSTGAVNPVPAGGGSAVAALDGKMYVVGGCNDSQCSSPLNAVEVYDPLTNTWSAAADYPHPVTFAACGAVLGKLYCAGGSASGEYRDGYVYDPAQNRWSPIADIPVTDGGLWGGAYAGTAQGLLMSGGVTGNFTTLTNAGYRYDPRIDSWSSLPNANNALYRGASACGFYRIGGSPGRFIPSSKVEVLPGYASCGATPIPWLDVQPATGNVSTDASKSIALDFNGAGQTAYTTSRAYLLLTHNAADAPQIIPLTVSWDPQPVDLVLSAQTDPSTVSQGKQLTYTLTLENRAGDNHGPATEIKLDYALPDGATYVADASDSRCTETTGQVNCALGDMAVGATQTIAIAITPGSTRAITSDFSVSAREPDSDTNDNRISVTTPANNGGGGGALGWLMIAALLGLCARRRFPISGLSNKADPASKT